MFKERFTKLCTERKLSPTDVCKQIGLSNSMYSKWTNTSIPRNSTLLKLADYFGVCVEYLRGEVEYRTLNEAADFFEITADRAIENLTEWLEDHGYEVGTNDHTENGGGLEWYITKDNQTAFFEDNHFKAEAVTLATLLNDPEDVIYADWVLKAIGKTAAPMSDRAAALLSIFNMVDEGGRMKIIQTAMNERDRTQREKTANASSSAV